MASSMDSMMPSMPGTYFLQHDHGRSNGWSSNVFQPPAPTPTSSRRFSQIPRSTSRSSSYTSNRKRPRLDSNTSYFSRPTRPSTYERSNVSTPFAPDGSYDHVGYNGLTSSTYSLDDQSIASPSPLANSTYQLAEGLDTPSASFERGLDQLAQDDAAKDYRLNRYTNTNTSRTTLSTNCGGNFETQSQTLDLSITSNNSRKRARSPRSSVNSSTVPTNWGLRNVAWALTGGLAGKVFNFCINTAFGGFKAGGGDTYQIAPVLVESRHVTGDAMHAYDGEKCLTHENYTHDLGGFVDDYINSPGSYGSTRQETATGKNSVQRNTCKAEQASIKNDWQIIDQVNWTDSGEEQSPARKRSRASVAGTWQRPSSRDSMGSRAGTPSGASYAFSRARPSSGSYQHQRYNSSDSIRDAPFQPVRRVRSSAANVSAPPRRSHTNFHSSAIRNNGNVSPERPSSSASMRRHQIKSRHDNDGFNTNLSPEVVSYKRKIRASEKVQDENLRRLNAQLRDMIREGREALGSTVEIFDDPSNGTNVHHDFDEGYYDDGWK